MRLHLKSFQRSFFLPLASERISRLTTLLSSHIARSNIQLSARSETDKMSGRNALLRKRKTERDKVQSLDDGVDDEVQRFESQRILNKPRSSNSSDQLQFSVTTSGRQKETTETDAMTAQNGEGSKDAVHDSLTLPFRNEARSWRTQEEAHGVSTFVPGIAVAAESTTIPLADLVASPESDWLNSTRESVVGLTMRREASPDSFLEYDPKRSNGYSGFSDSGVADLGLEQTDTSMVSIDPLLQSFDRSGFKAYEEQTEQAFEYWANFEFGEVSGDESDYNISGKTRTGTTVGSADEDDLGETTVHKRQPSDDGLAEEGIRISSPSEAPSRKASMTDTASSGWDEETDWDGESSFDSSADQTCLRASYFRDDKPGSSCLRQQFSSAQSKLTERLMAEFWIVFDHRWQAQSRQRGQASTSSQSTQSQPASDDIRSGSHPTVLIPSKRIRVNNNENSDDEQNRPSKRKGKERERIDSPELPPGYACPYRKYNPRKYSVQAWRTCALTPHTSVPRVK